MFTLFLEAVSCCGKASMRCAVLLTILVGQANVSEMPRSGSRPSLRLRGGTSDVGSRRAEVSGDSKNPSSQEIWQNVYLTPGFSSVCEDRFDIDNLGCCLESDQQGTFVKNSVYGASSARTRQVMRYGGRRKMFYFEAELTGGDTPIRGWKGMEVEGEWISAEQLCGDGTGGASIGVIAGGTLTCFDNSTVPDDCFVYYATGQLRWPWAFNEPFDDTSEKDSSLTALSGLLPSPRKSEWVFRSGDRYGVLVDFHTNKIGFFRNGVLIPEFSRSLSPHVPPLVLRFMVGGMRPDTTWRICSREEGLATLEKLDWREWVGDLNPNCVDWRPEHIVKESCSPEMLEEYRAFIAPYVEQLKREGRRD